MSSQRFLIWIWPLSAWVIWLAVEVVWPVSTASNVVFSVSALATGMAAFCDAVSDEDLDE